MHVSGLPLTPKKLLSSWSSHSPVPAQPMVPFLEECYLPGPELKDDLPVLGFCTLMGEKLTRFSELKSSFQMEQGKSWRSFVGVRC